MPKVYSNCPQIPVRLYSVIAIHGPIKGPLQAEKNVLYYFNFEIRVLDLDSTPGL